MSSEAHRRERTSTVFDGGRSHRTSEGDDVHAEHDDRLDTLEGKVREMASPSGFRAAAAILAAVLTALAAWVAQAHIGTDLRSAIEAIIVAVQGFLVPASIRTVHTAAP